MFFPSGDFRRTGDHRQLLTTNGTLPTRERVRQIEKSLWKKISKPVSQKQLGGLETMLQDTLQALDGIATLNDIGKTLSERFGWITPVPERIIDVLIKIFSDSFQIIKKRWCVTKAFRCHRCGKCIGAFLKTLNASSREEYPISQLCIDASGAFDSICVGCADAKHAIPSESLLALLFHANADPLPGWHLDGTNMLRSRLWIIRKGSLQKMIEEVLLTHAFVMTYNEIFRIISELSFDGRNNLTQKQVWTAANTLVSQNDSVLLWERGGKYIHRDHVNPYLPVISAIEKKIVELLSAGDVSQMSLYNIFDEHREDCLAAGLPSAHTVFSLLKVRTHPKLRFLKTPYVAWHSTRGSKRSIKEILEEYIFDHESGVSQGALRDHAYKNLGMTKEHLSNCKQRSENVARGGLKAWRSGVGRSLQCNCC